MHAVKSVERLIESVSTVLGFPPEESLVILSVRDGSVDWVARVDLREVTADGVVERLGATMVRDDAQGVVLVVVSADSVGCRTCAREFEELAGEFGDALERRGGELLGAVVVDRIAGGGRWYCADGCGRGGVLKDPATSTYAAEAAVAGRRMYSSRAELKASVGADVARRAAVAAMLDGAGGDVDDVEQAVGGVVAAMRRMAGGAVPTAAELAAAGASLVDVRVRDALLSLSDSADSVAAAELWMVLARGLPQPFRVEALSLVAMSAYMRGDGPLAGVAVEAALEEVPGHRLTGLIDRALQCGIRPDQMSKVLAGARPVAV